MIVFRGTSTCYESSLDQMKKHMVEMKDSDIVKIPFKESTIIIAIVMSGGFILCIVLALMYHFEQTTWTHCEVPNYLPSISAAISVPPSAYVWRLVVAVCSAPRIATVFFHYRHYSNQEVTQKQYYILCRICFTCEFLENICLIGLTYVSSVENHGWHAKFFIGFQAFAMIFMLLMCKVYSMAPGDETTSGLQKKTSVRGKWIVLMVNFFTFFFAMYCYYIHNRDCQPGVYTMFALFEYAVVLTNVSFHALVSLDFKDREIYFGVKKRPL